MMRSKALIAALALTMTPLSAAGAQTPAAPAAQPRPISQDLRTRTFDTVWNKVARTYWDPAFGGHDWVAIGARYRPQALATGDSLQFHALLNRMVGELGVSHFRVLAPETLARARAQAGARRGWIGARVRVVGGEAVVVAVDPGSPAAAAGVGPGWVVVAVGGTAIRPDMSSAHVQEMLAGPVGEPCTVDLRDSADRRLSLSLPRAPLPGAFYPVRVLGITLESIPPRYAELESRRLEGGVAYLRLSRFVPALVPQLRSAIQAMGDATGLILDLRGNPGGEDVVGVRLAEMLVAAPAILMVTRTRAGSHDYRLHPAPVRFDGPLVILVDADSASASEQLAAGLQELGRARVVGERTAGHDLDADAMRLPTGGLFTYGTGLPMTPHGMVIEGRGVRPDMDVPLRREDLLRGNDPQLAAALAAVARLSRSRPSQR